MSKLIYLTEWGDKYHPEPNYYSEVIAYRYFSGLYRLPGYSYNVIASDRYTLDHEHALKQEEVKDGPSD